ncbi:MAG: ion channel [Mariprofundaceae bacterium]|nr:ion channel [Mariprofundaceae bacterium]
MDVLLFLLTVGAFMVSFRKEAPDWWQLAILSLFVLCFLWRWHIASDRVSYIRRNWLDLVFVVLLASPVLRLFTAFRFARLAPALRLGGLMRKHRVQLLKLILLSRDSFPVAMALVFGMVFLFGTSTYLLEHHQNPSFSSISDGLWWAFVTLTTVGYGDIVPVTEAGRIIAALTMAFGIAVYSLLIANLTHFLETLEGLKQSDKTDS